MALHQCVHILCTAQDMGTTGQSSDPVDVQRNKSVAKETHKLVGFVRKKHFWGLRGWREGGEGGGGVDTEVNTCMCKCVDLMCKVTYMHVHSH